MKIFVIADTHFGHENIIKYCNRPFQSAEEMNKALIKNWNSVVGKEDKVYMLGDFCLSGNKKVIESYVRQLNGQKSLIIGNHDRLSVKKYYECGFEFVSKYPIIIKNFVILSHAPMFINDNCFYFNIYGHVHDSSAYETRTKQSWCVSVERQDYRPAELIMEGEQK